MKFANPHFLWLLPCIVMTGFALFRWSRRIAREKLARFGPPERLPRILHSVDHRAAARKFWIVVGALCLVVIAMARPMLPPRLNEAKLTGTEFFIILDVSKSMLVRDVEPNRLEAVKASLLEWLKTRAGDRIGLILMAGDAFVQAPLTHDLTALRGVLEESEPASISKGGSHVAGAIEAAMNALEKSGVKNRVAVLISDGGATEGKAMEALQKARTTGKLTLFTVGVGTAAGGPVPTAPQKGKKEDFTKPPAGYVTDEYGMRATSRLDERSLRLLAGAGGGRYFAFDPEDDVWNRLYTQALQPHARQMDASNLKNHYDLFQLPLFLALALLVYQSTLSTRLKNPPRPKLAVILPDGGAAAPAATMKDHARPAGSLVAVALILAAWFATFGNVQAAPEVITPVEAEKLIKEGRAADAAKRLWDAAQKDPENYYLIYNFGIAAYAMGNFGDAVNAFSEAALSKDEKLHTMALTQLGNAQFRMGQALQKAGKMEGSIVSWERAVEYYESAVAERGDSVSKHNLGVAARELEKALLESARRALDAANANPKVESRINPLTAALEKFEKAEALNPANKDTTAHVEQTRKLLSESLAQQARLNREEAVKVSGDPKKDPQQAELNLKARQNYEKAVELAPENKPLETEFGDFKKTVANEFSDAAETLLKQAADLIPVAGKKGEDHLNKKQNILSQAVARADQALAFDEQNQRAKDVLAKAQSELEKTLEARGDILKESGDKSAAQSAAAEKAQKEAEAAGKDKEATNRERESASQAQAASGQYSKAADDYRKALEVNPDNKGVQSKLAEVEARMATALAKAAEGEMNNAEESIAQNKDTPPGNESDQGEASEKQPGAAELQKAIGHLEKAVAMLDQAEALAPGKNEAEALGKQASAKLEAKRGELEKAQGKAQQAKADGSEKGEKGQKGEKGEKGESSDKPTEGKPGETEIAGNVNNPLNFSEIREQGSEKQGQFVDKTKKERIRDW